MSVIQTIRNKYGKIAGGVIAVALVGFIVSDARNGSFGDLFGGKDPNVMKINGVKIDPKEYQQRVKEYETLYMMFNKGRALDDATKAQMNEQLVQQIVYEAVVGEQCDKLGIVSTDEENKELIYGQYADPIVRQFQIEGQQVFINPDTKQFDPQIIKYMEKQFAEAPQKIDPNGKLREQWAAVKSYVIRQARINKYNTMFAGSVYSPGYISKMAAADQGSMAAIRYVKVPFTSVADNDVKVTDDDIKAYMQKHAAQFQVDQQARSIEYVSFDIKPSSADTARSLNALAEIKTDFAAAKDNKSFVNSKTDDANSYSEAYLNKRTFMSRDADSIMSAPTGSIYGPYYEDGSFKLTKVVDKQTLPDSSKIRHILVKTKDRDTDVMSDSAAKQKIDSAIAAINGGMKFDSAVSVYSVDEGSKKTGGEYTFTLLQRPTISKEFGDFAFEGKPGEKKLVKVSNEMYSGYHYIEILEQHGTAPAVQLATIAKNLAPSDSTVRAILGKANEFAGQATVDGKFDETVKKMNLDKRMADNIKATNFTMQGLGASREVVRWMYDHKVGDVSPVFQLGEERYVVAKLIAETEKGLMTITAANRPMLEQKVREEMKADIIVKKYGSSASVDAVAAASSQPVQQSDSVMANGAYIPNAGYEPKVVGYVFCPTFQPNTLSPGIKGQGGIYFVTVTSRTNNSAQADPNVLMQIASMQSRQQEMQLKGSIGQLLQQSVIKNADVKYNANNF